MQQKGQDFRGGRGIAKLAGCTLAIGFGPVVAAGAVVGVILGGVTYIFS